MTTNYAAVHLIMLLALFEYFIFTMAVGRARYQYGVKAPATTGDENFERVYRVQMNTLEMLALFQFLALILKLAVMNLVCGAIASELFYKTLQMLVI
mgnify:CR=1 FL=1